jgi:hypothetical protein
MSDTSDMSEMSPVDPGWLEHVAERITQDILMPALRASRTTGGHEEPFSAAVCTDPLDRWDQP